MMFSGKLVYNKLVANLLIYFVSKFQDTCLVSFPTREEVCTYWLSYDSLNFRSVCSCYTLFYAPLALHHDIMHHMCILYIYPLVMHT